MSDLNSKRRSILQYEPKELLDFVLDLRTKRRNSIITAATNRAARAAAKQPKKDGASKKAAALISNLDTEQVLALLERIKGRKEQGE